MDRYSNFFPLAGCPSVPPMLCSPSIEPRLRPSYNVFFLFRARLVPNMHAVQHSISCAILIATLLFHSSKCSSVAA
jgi:hypothetical protein